MLRSFRICFLLLLLIPSPQPAAAPECPDLSPGSAAKRMGGLEQEISYHNNLYYKRAAPVITDAEYDRMFAELVRLEQCFPALASPDSPTRKIAADADSGALTVRHEAPMLSLTSSTTPEAVEALFVRVQKIEKDARLLVQPKVDGLPVEIIYRSGRLTSAATRGDGRSGADVTDVVRKIPGIPIQLSGDFPERVVVRGEVYADRRLMPGATGRKRFATPRHFAAALLKSRHPDPRGLAALRLFPFDFVNSRDVPGVMSDLAALRKLALWGFPVRLDLSKEARKLEDLSTQYSGYLGRRGRLDFAADGIVVKVDDLAMRHTLGEGTRAPFWAAAWKFPPETAMTSVTRIRWKTGRTGRRTPVAEVAPVTIAGIRVTRVSLQNPGTAERLGVAAGDKVVIGMVGDVIPQLVSVQKGKREGAPDTSSSQAPQSVTACLTDAPGCREQFLERAAHFTSSKGLNIKGLGPGRLRKLIEAGLVRDLPSILKLQVEEMARIPGIGSASAGKLAAELRRVGHPAPFRLVAALGIPGVGPKAARALAARYETLEELLDSQDQREARAAGLKVREFFDTAEGSELLKGLRDAGAL